MKASIRAALMLPALLAFPVQALAQRERSDTALATMIAAERAFSQYSLQRGAQNAFLRFMARDSYLYRPKVVSAQAFLRRQPLPPGTLLTWEPAYADMSASGDFGYTTGEWISSRQDIPDAQPVFGQYVTVWRRQTNGIWQAEVNVGIAHAPDAVGVKSLVMAPAPEYRSAARNADADRASLLAADSALAQLARGEGAAVAFQRRVAPGFRMLRRNRFPLRGDSANAVLRATPNYRWQPAGAGISAAGDLGYTFGVYTSAPPLGGNTESGDYFRLWRRDRSGLWRVVLDLTSPAR